MIQNKKTNAFVLNGGESKASDIFEDLFKAGFLRAEEKKKLHDILDPFYQTLYKRGDSEEYWEEVRGFWAFKEPSENGVVMMNAANLCPEPEPLIEMGNYLRTIYNKDVSMQVRTGRGRYVLGLEKSRETIGKALGLEGEKLKNLAMVRNASEANNTISSGYHNWNPNGTDRVILWEGNHPTNIDVWHMRSKWDGQKIRENPLFQIAEVKFGREADADEIADAFIKEIDANTRFVTFSYISNGSGTRIPEQAIDKIWKKVNELPDCHLHIDGTMAWGAWPLDFSNPSCHSFSSSSHKWFIGPKETGILYMRPEKVGNFIPSIIAYNYKIEFPYWDGWEQAENRIGETAVERFELLGQRDDVNIIALAATQLMWSALSPTRAVKRIGELASYLKEKLIKSGWEFVTPEKKETSWAIIRVEAGRDESKSKLVDYLYKKGIAGAEGGDSPGEETVRLCPTIYNLKKHLDYVVKCMDEWKDE